MYFIFTPIFGKMFQIDEHIFQMGGEKPPSSQLGPLPVVFFEIAASS